jgi:hypothetical protein
MYARNGDERDPFGDPSLDWTMLREILNSNATRSLRFPAGDLSYSGIPDRAVWSNRPLNDAMIEGFQWTTCDVGLRLTLSRSYDIARKDERNFD